MRTDLVKTSTADTGRPYVKARTSKGASGWFVVFYAWDADKNKLVRKRYERGINVIKNPDERAEFCRKLCREINFALKSGAHFYLDPGEVRSGTAIKDVVTICDTLEYVLVQREKRLRERSAYAYRRAAELFIEYLDEKGMRGKLSMDITRVDMVFFRDWLLRTKTTLKNVSVNNVMAFLSTLFTDIKDRGWITGENPLAKFKGLRESDHVKYWSFSQDELSAVKKHLSVVDPYAWLFAQFIFYTFIRPKELRLLRVEYVDLKKKTIMVPGDISKNIKTQYVHIPPPLAALIENMELSRHKKQDYLFTAAGVPGKKKLSANYMGRHFRAGLQALGFPDGHSLYSMKHTGVEMHYLGGMDIKAIQAQCRHAKIETTDKYLKRLNVHRDFESTIYAEI